MKEQNKKTFQSTDVKRINRLKKLIWLIPVVIAIYMVFLSRNAFIEQLQEEFSFAAILGYIAFILMFLPILSIIPFSIARGYVKRAHQELIKNNTFHTIQDFDYFRDTLEGISPGSISLLVNLKLKPQKDMVAYLLKFEEMGILRNEDNHYFTTEKYNADVKLKPSERYLIDHLVKNNSDVSLDTNWQSMVEQEAIQDGFIVNNEEKKTKSFKWILILLLVIGSLVIFSSISGQLDEMFEILSEAEELSNINQMRYILKYPQFIPLIGLLLLIAVLLIRSLFFPIIAISQSLGLIKNKVKFKRTPKGDEMAEYIYGLKNFIHEFSNLKEADKKHLVLWDDYLVYAVVLEENQRIIQEVINLRKNN